MEETNKKRHKYIKDFNPDVVLLTDSHQDFNFTAGPGYKNFDEFIQKEALDYTKRGAGVTYLVYNVKKDVYNQEVSREPVAYYTLTANAIPYIYRIYLDEDEAKEVGQPYLDELWGINASEIKMFAVDQKYQDVFFEFDGDKKPISAWILQNIIDIMSDMSHSMIGFKAIFLHSIPEAENFYLKNGFQNMSSIMQPFHCIDYDLTPLYLALNELDIEHLKDI